MLDDVTKKRINTLRQVLVGKLPDPKAQVEQITNGLIYKFMNDMDEQSVSLGGKASYFSGKFEKYSWKNLMNSKTSGSDRLELYKDAIEKMYNNENYIEHILYHTFTISNSDILTTNIYNILYDSLIVKPSYKLQDYNIEIDIVYFTEITLIDPTLRKFENNIQSFKVNNPYNYDITVYFQMIDTIYPEYTINKNGVEYKNYGLKTEII